MKRRAVVLPAFLFLSSLLWSSEPSIRVGIFPNVRSVTLGPGAYKAAALPGGDLGLRRWNAQIPVQADARGLYVGRERFAKKVRFAPVKEGDVVLVDGRPYRGAVELLWKGPGRFTVVNEAGLEDYVRGVVSQEMSHSWPAEALRCQAVVARSYAVANKGRFGKDGYDLCATAACQVYGGKEAEHPSTDKAVDDTRGEVLTYKGDVISAVFHSCCGGQTDDSKDVWRGKGLPYLEGVRCRWCRNESPHYQWKSDISDPVLEDALKAGGHGVGEVKSVRIVSRTGSGRAYEVRITGENGGVTMNANAFRLLLGDKVLKSTFWSGISHERGTWRFSGRGWGHGVGLCQWCARATAEKGYKYKEILTYFYRHTKVKVLS